MRPIAMLRELWGLRHAIKWGILIALAGGILMSYRVSLDLPPKLETRQYEAGVAAAEVLVDSPNSQVVDVGGGSPDVEGSTIDIGGLSTRARLLASLVSSSPLKDRIASAAGIRPDKLVVIAPTSNELAPRATPATSTTVKVGDRDANVLNLFVDETLPIITMSVEAPDAATARRLAGAAVDELGAYLKSVASARSIPDARQLVVSSLGPATSRTVVKGPTRLVAVVVALLIFGIWCVAAMMIPRLAKTWTEAARYDAAKAAEAAAALDDLHRALEDGTFERKLAPVRDASKTRASRR
jgi:hypothetical protein